jgi:ribosomal protein L23
MAGQSVSMINNPYRRTDLSSRVEFRVPLDMNKIEIKEYLSKLYGFSIKKVNTMIVEGKRKKQGKPFLTQLPDWKKAIVFLQNPTAAMAPRGRPQGA